jgi:predicted chitinase
MADSKPINWAYPFKAKAADGDSSPSNVTPALYYDALANSKDGFYPLGANGLWHGGIHFDAGTAASLDQSAIGCIADGEVVAYRIDDRYPTSQYGEGPTAMHLPFSSGFVLVKHSLALPEPPAPATTEEGSDAETAAAPASEPMTFYSLYMHLQDWTGYKAAAAPTAPDFLGDTLYSVKADKATDNLVGLRVRSAAKTGTVKALLAKGSKVKVSDSDPISAKWRKLLTIIEGSAIPALSGEELGWVYTGEMDEVPGETDTYLVADAAQDVEPTVATTMGLNVRKAGNSSSKITGLLPLGTKFKIKSGSGAYRELVEIVEGQDIAPLSANSVQRIKGFVHFDSLDAVRSVPTLDRVQILARPLPIKAGDLVGHLGQYQNYSDNRPRSLVHIEVFTCENVPAFIAKSQAAAARLPAEQKTLIKVHAGSSILQPSDADSQVATGLDVRLSSDSPKEGCWAKVQQYAELKIDKSSLGSYDATHKRYALNAAQKSTLATQLGVEASELPDTADFLLEYYDADGSNPQTYTSGGIPAGQPMRKIGVRLNTAYWVARNKLNSQGGRSSTSGALDAWKTFPLQTGTDGQACGYDRILPGASWGNLANEHKAIAPDNIRWWYVTVGDKDGKDISGWVPEIDPIITKHSPWEWPGFSTLQDKAPLDAHLARTLDATGRATEEEAQSYTALIDEAERGPILSELYKVIDLPNEAGVRDNKLIPAELKTALGKPWLAQQLSLLISQYESEWMWNADKWNQLDKLMEHTPEDPNPNWVTEKKRIETLGWWKELADQPGIAADGVAWHFHPMGTIGCFYKSDTSLITMEMLQITKPSSDSSYYEEILPYLNEYADAYEVNTPIRIAHFLAQVGHESGFRVRSEDGNYSATRMREIFGCVGGKKNYNKATDECSLGRLRDKLWTDETTYANNPRKLLSFVYSSRMGNGDEASEDGYKFRGRGIIQLTGKNNYRKYTEIHNSANPGDVKDFVENPDLIITTAKYGVESGFVYWAMVNANTIADADNSERLTIAINGGMNGYDERIECLEKLKAHLGL